MRFSLAVYSTALFRDAYDTLDSILAAVPANENISFLNTITLVKGNADMWDDGIGREGVGHFNDKRMLLLSKYVEYKLLIMNTTHLGRTLDQNTGV